jgi:hypothetical protein
MTRHTNATPPTPQPEGDRPSRDVGASDRATTPAQREAPPLAGEGGARIELVKGLTLSPSDQKHLATLEQKFQIIRDYTRSVADGRTTGFYLYGKGGCGKSHNVIHELDRLGVPYKLFNSRMTGRGLYNALEAFPDSLHLLEDMEQLFRDGGARGVLRSALWGQSRKGDGPFERPVTWTTYKTEHQFIFTGGIIMTANRGFPELPELEAIKTRIEYMQLAVSDNELIALMRNISLGGYKAGREMMDPVECLEVCEFIISQCRGLNRAMDLRVLTNGRQDYLQWRECQAGCHWRDLVATRVKERPIGLEEAHSHTARAIQKQKELAFAVEIAAMTNCRHERLKLWYEKTEKSEQTLYRRLKELKIDTFSDSQ